MPRPQFLLILVAVGFTFGGMSACNPSGSGDGDGNANQGSPNDNTNDSTVETQRLVEVLDPDNEVAAYLQTSVGDMAVIAEKNAAGEPLQVTAVRFENEVGEMTVFLGGDGLPTHLVADDWVFVFQNFTDDSVDVTVIAPNGLSETYSDIDINGEHLLQLKSARLARANSRSLSTHIAGSPIKGASRLAFKISWGKLWDVAEGALAVAKCGAAAAGTIVAAGGTLGAAAVPGIVITGAVCFQAGLTIGELIWGVDEEDTADLHLAADAAACLAGECSGLIGNVAADVFEAAEYAAIAAAAEMTLDSDGDGIYDYLDNCDFVADFFQYDTDGDGIGDVCDSTPLGGDIPPDLPDGDGDGVPDVSDGCPNDPNKTSPGNCDCGEPETPGCGGGTEAEDYEFVTAWAYTAANNGLTASPSGLIYIHDSSIVECYTDNGVFVGSWDIDCCEGGHGIVVNSSGEVYVNRDRSIEKYSSDGIFLTEFSGSFNADLYFIEIGPQGHIYVASYWDDWIKSFTSNGELLDGWNVVYERASGDIRGLGVDGEGHVYFSDRARTIVKLTADLEFVEELVPYAVFDGPVRPSVLAFDVDKEGNSYVLFRDNEQDIYVEKYSNDGAFITKWGRSGDDDGEFFWEGRVMDIAVDMDGNVYVSDNRRTQKFAPLQ